MVVCSNLIPSVTVSGSGQLIQTANSWAKYGKIFVHNNTTLIQPKAMMKKKLSKFCYSNIHLIRLKLRLAYMRNSGVISHLKQCLASMISASNITPNMIRYALGVNRASSDLINFNFEQGVCINIIRTKFCIIFMIILYLLLDGMCDVKISSKIFIITKKIAILLRLPRLN